MIRPTRVHPAMLPKASQGRGAPRSMPGAETPMWRRGVSLRDNMPRTRLGSIGVTLHSVRRVERVDQPRRNVPTR